MKNYLTILLSAFALVFTSCEKIGNGVPAFCIENVTWTRLSDYSFEIDTNQKDSFFLSAGGLNTEGVGISTQSKIEKISDAENRLVVGAKTILTVTKLDKSMYKIVYEQDAHKLLTIIVVTWGGYDENYDSMSYVFRVQYEDGCWNPL